jgi:hypothetical protein
MLVYYILDTSLSDLFPFRVFPCMRAYRIKY